MRFMKRVEIQFVAAKALRLRAKNALGLTIVLMRFVISRDATRSTEMGLWLTSLGDESG